MNDLIHARIETEKMNQFTLDIVHEGQPLFLTWNESACTDLIKFYRLQTGGWNWSRPDPSLQEFVAIARPRITSHFNDLTKAIGQIDHDGGEVKIVDVGAGIGIFDLLLHQKLSNRGIAPRMFLIDKDETPDPNKKNGLFHNPTTGYHFYNSWYPLIDAISAMGVPRSDFSMMSPSDTWPEEVDVVFSTYSWCWHYPPEIYLNQMLKSLKIGGKVALDLVHRPDRDFVSEISDALGSDPVFTRDILAPHIVPGHFLYDKMIVKDNGSLGRKCGWIRKR
jgi:SAM-dependent methyltransferase